MQFATEVIGFTASVISFAMWRPQAVQVWRGRRDAHALAGVSIQTQWLLAANAVLWLLYAILTQAFWVGAPSLVNLPLALVTIAILRRVRRPARTADARTEAPAGCPLCGWSTAGPHLIELHEAPGYGSCVTCSPRSASRGTPVAA